MDRVKEDLMADLNELPADIQIYMRKLADMNVFLSGSDKIKFFFNMNMIILFEYLNTSYLKL